MHITLKNLLKINDNVKYKLSTLNKTLKDLRVMLFQKHLQLSI